MHQICCQGEAQKQVNFGYSQFLEETIIQGDFCVMQQSAACFLGKINFCSEWGDGIKQIQKETYVTTVWGEPITHKID